MKVASSIAGLPFMSPVSVGMLGRIGIETISQLRSIGAVDVYARLKQSGEAASLPLLYAIEAGVSGCDITDISGARRAELVAVVANRHALEPHESSPVPREKIGDVVQRLPRASSALDRTWPNRTAV